MFTDLRHGVRLLLQRPVFTAVAVLTLALGIGATVAIFSIVDGVLLRPLALADPERLVVIWETHPALNVPYMVASPPHLAEWRNEIRLFDEVGGFVSTKLTIGDTGIADQIAGASVTEGLLPALGVAPALGRYFESADYRNSAPASVLLSNGLWRRRFNADPTIVGSRIRLSGRDYTVAGVMPAGFNFLPSITIQGKPPLERSEFWLPQSMGDPALQRGAHFLVAIGRLRTGVTLAAAERRLHEMAQRNGRDFPDDRDWDVHVVPLLQQATASARPTLMILLAAVGFVLLLACTNVANLLIARGVGRRKEMAVRTALGAGRLRLARQLLTESLVLATAGGAAGLLLAAWAVRFVRVFGPASIVRLDEAQIDARVVLFALGISFASALLFGAAPLLQTFEVTSDALKERSGSDPAGGARVRSLLVAVEVAIAIVLLVGGALLMESFLRLRSASPGFNPKHALTFRVTLPPSRYPTRLDRNRFAREALRRLGGAPGVIAAGLIDSVPIGEDRQGTSFFIEAPSSLAPGTEGHTNISFPSAGYFDAIGLPVLRGRPFSENDAADARPVIIVNQTLARQVFGNADPIGRQMRVGFSRQTVRTIVGVVADDHHTGVGREVVPNVYLPYEQVAFTGAHSFVVRTEADIATTTSVIRRAIDLAEPDAAIYHVRTLEQIVSDSMSSERFSTLLLAAFAAAALALAFVGIYGVTDQAVSQRTQELGIRMALGAAPSRILGMVVAAGLKLTLAGVAAGLAAAAALSRFLSAQLFGVSPLDARAYLAVALLLVAAAALACYVPARRATRIDPLTALRTD